jgi:cell division transport system permease protein
VLEVVFSALVGAVLACGSVFAVMQVFVPWLRAHLQIWPWIDAGAASEAMIVIVVIALVLAVVPTLLMTRKYLNV